MSLSSLLTSFEVHFIQGLVDTVRRNCMGTTRTLFRRHQEEEQNTIRVLNFGSDRTGASKEVNV